MTIFLKFDGFNETGIDIVSFSIDEDIITYTDVERNTFNYSLIGCTAIRVVEA